MAFACERNLLLRRGLSSRQPARDLQSAPRDWAANVCQRLSRSRAKRSSSKRYVGRRCPFRVKFVQIGERRMHLLAELIARQRTTERLHALVRLAPMLLPGSPKTGISVETRRVFLCKNSSRHGIQSPASLELMKATSIEGACESEKCHSVCRGQFVTAKAAKPQIAIRRN